MSNDPVGVLTHILSDGLENGLRKLFQETNVVLEKSLNVVNPVLQHGQTIDADAKSEAADLLRIVIHKAVNGRINHAGAKQFNPAGTFAFTAGATGSCGPTAAAKNAGGVEFNGRFGERKIARTEAALHVLPKKRFDKVKADPYFNALQVKFAYAVTCHKSQGGQWKAVFVDQGYFVDDMLNIEYLRWLYTALTRAAEKLFLVNFKDEFFIK